LTHPSLASPPAADPHVNDSGGPQDIVCTSGLTKRYGDFEALSDCGVRIRRGQVFGLLGPNGAGKTTLIRLMMGFLFPTSGSCRIDGLDPWLDGVQLRQRIAYLPGDARLPRHMRGAGVLKLFSEMHPGGDLSRSRDIAAQLELDLTRRVAFMSTGMRQKLALAVVLGLNTPLLILDEPTANLDPTVRATVLRLVVEARGRGCTVLFSSHVLGEIEETCDRVVFLRRGQLVHELVMSELFQRHRITAQPMERPIAVPSPFGARVQCRVAGQGPQARLRIDTAGDLAPLLPWLDSLGLKQVRIEPLGLRAVYDSVHSGSEIGSSDHSGWEDEV
jgi:ABC-2 type transport system ATP-binding protein